jgi:hypothetical protein
MLLARPAGPPRSARTRASSTPFLISDELGVSDGEIKRFDVIRVKSIHVAALASNIWTPAAACAMQFAKRTNETQSCRAENSEKISDRSRLDRHAHFHGPLFGWWWRWMRAKS